jgi:predicted lipid carrier protein YhbT
MPSPTDEFFEELNHRGYDPLVARVQGTLRFEVTHRGATDVHNVTVDRGHLSVSGDGGHADCAIRVERSVFDAIVSGKSNAMAALLRGALSAEGNPEMMVIFQRLLSPAPNRMRHDAVTTVAGW